MFIFMIISTWPSSTCSCPCLSRGLLVCFDKSPASANRTHRWRWLPSLLFCASCPLVSSVSPTSSALAYLSPLSYFLSCFDSSCRVALPSYSSFPFSLLLPDFHLFFPPSLSYFCLSSLSYSSICLFDLFHSSCPSHSSCSSLSSSFSPSFPLHPRFLLPLMVSCLILVAPLSIHTYTLSPP